MNVDETLCFGSYDYFDEPLYFCGDDLYGYYSFDEMQDIIDSLQKRLNFLKENFKK